MAPPTGADPDPARLRALADRLGETPERVARTLHGELLQARAALDAGLADGNLTAVADAAHGARNSALMVGAGPLLDELRALETAADAGELQAAREARARAGERLAHLIEALAALD